MCTFCAIVEKMLPPRRSLKKIFKDEESAIDFLIDQRIVIIPDACPNIHCQAVNFTRRHKKWRCNVKQCKKEWAVFSGSFFSQCRLKVNETLELSYLWLLGLKHGQICNYTGFGRKTITRKMKELRQLVSDSLDFTDMQIGGEGVVVEIDESKLGKNKYHKGHEVKGAWVLGGVERTDERKLFIVEVPDRKEATLLAIIKTHVLPGSIIITDCFKSYFNLNKLYEHFTVDHSKNFVDPESGAHTNSIEGTWCALKYKIAPRNRTKSIGEDGQVQEELLGDFLCEFQWRRKNSGNLWEGFLTALSEVKYISPKNIQ